MNFSINFSSNFYSKIISYENLLEAWKEFSRGKSKKEDVIEFSFLLSKNISSLHGDLVNRKYVHGSYQAFSINDPKPRNIHKASVRDRLLHHAIYRILYSYFDKKFIYDSYSCRAGKGTHKALNRFKNFATEASSLHTKTLWVLKCDIRKFFASIDHKVLLEILKKHIIDEDTLFLLEEIIGSFETQKGKGLPLGNLTSQLLVNIYMNEFDQWMKQVMKVKYYIRYADDFVIISQDKDYLLELTPKIAEFLQEHLKLSLHPDKVFIKTLASGVDFLGWVHFPTHLVLRCATKKRMMRNVSEKNESSYAGLLRYGDTWKLSKQILFHTKVLPKKDI